jgi:hypothetical protein
MNFSIEILHLSKDGNDRLNMHTHLIIISHLKNVVASYISLSLSPLEIIRKNDQEKKP